MLRSTKKTSVENTLVFCFIRYLKFHSQGWIRTAAEPTAACGGNREARLGQRSAFSKPCQGAAEKAASATRKTRRTVRREKSPCATATTAASGRNREELLGLRPAGCACRPRHDAAAGSRDPGSFLFCAAREIHEKCANKNHRPGGWWFGDREKTGFTLKRARRRRGQRARACWILAKSSNVRASGRMRASNPAASMAAVTASLGIPRPLAMALAAVLRR